MKKHSELKSWLLRERGKPSFEPVELLEPEELEPDLDAIKELVEMTADLREDPPLVFSTT